MCYFVKHAGLNTGWIWLFVKKGRIRVKCSLSSWIFLLVIVLILYISDSFFSDCVCFPTFRFFELNTKAKEWRICISFHFMHIFNHVFFWLCPALPFKSGEVLIEWVVQLWARLSDDCWWQIVLHHIASTSPRQTVRPSFISSWVDVRAHPAIQDK